MSLRITFLALISIIIGVGAIGCLGDEDSPTGPEGGNGNQGDPNEIIPMKVGYSWTGENKEFEDGVLMETKMETTRITGTYEWGGNTWYILTQDGDQDDYYYRNASDGFRYLDFDDATSRGEEFISLKFPAEVGDMFRPDNQMRVESTNKTIVVPAGTFTGCYEYLYRDGDDSLDYFKIWAKPGVGLIKTEEYDHEGEGGGEDIETFELTSYDLREQENDPADDDTTRSNLGDELMPLSVGNYWYANVDLYRDGEKEFEFVDTLSIVGTMEWGGHTWYHMKEGDEEEPEYSRNGDGGYWELEYDAENPAESEAYVMFKYPASVGDNWEADDNRWEVMGVDVSVTVPAGTFNHCYHYRADDTDDNDSHEIWIDPSVGPVKQLAMDEDEDDEGVIHMYRIEWNLSEYHVE